MQFTTSILAVISLAIMATADLHYSGLCIDNVGGQKVFNDAATRAACGNYQVRNTGSAQWDTCPDCEIVTTGGLTYCHSAAQHIGGDELNHYCTKVNGAGGSLAD
ncbi:hypothetical protein N0V90_003829 [Kalmusia sp. IMI 367209]|nr:hypothetical protein N0V90_003829 [Kalmusia sp. IMI 367209]